MSVTCFEIFRKKIHTYTQIKQNVAKCKVTTKLVNLSKLNWVYTAPFFPFFCRFDIFKIKSWGLPGWHSG